MLTLAQIKSAWQAVIAAGNAFNQFPLRDYLLFRIYENTYNPTPSGGTLEETLTSVEYDNTSISSTIAAGAFCVTIETSEDFDGSINGITRNPSRAYTYRANYNHTLPQIPIIVLAGTVKVDIQL